MNSSLYVKITKHTLNSLIKWHKQSSGPALPGWVFLFLLVSYSALALDPNRSLFQYNCKTWTRQDGLPANGVNAISQTKDGYVWLGTSMGLVRFDGVDFTLLDMSHIPQMRSTIVTSLSDSREGGLWFGLDRGAFGYYDGKDTSFWGKENWGGVNLNVHSVLETPKGDLWIGAETLAARMTETNHSYQAILDSTTGLAGSDVHYDVTAVCQDSQGRVWLGTVRRGLFYWKDGKLTKFPEPLLDDRIVRSVAEDNQGQIWIGTETGVLCYDANFKRKTDVPWPWYETRALMVDRHGIVWAGTSGGGIARYQNGAFTQFRKADGLADDFVTTLMEDQEGSVWVGTRNGLSQFSDIKIPTFGKTEGLPADVYVSVSASRRGGLWVATGAGFTYFDRNSLENTSTFRLNNSYVREVFEAKNGDIYAVDGSMKVVVFSGTNIVAEYPCKNWPTAFTEDAKSVLLTVSGEIYRMGTNFFTPYSFDNAQKPQVGWIFNMITDRDNSIWAATGDGILHFKDGKFKLWTTAQGLTDNKITWICEDHDGVIWAGLEAGMVRLKDEQIRRITQNNGLFDNIIYAIVPDDYGTLWVDSSRGFFAVTKKSLNDFADGKTTRVECVAYDGLDAVKSSEKSNQEQSGCKTPDGRIWFPTAQGIVMINPANIAVNPVPPKIHIQSVRANGVDLDLAGKSAVRPGKGELEFHYAGLSYLAPQKIQYRYKLDGYDAGWVDAGTRHLAFYTNLKPGKYHFEVQACNEDGVWNTVGTSYAVELLPHYYQTTWFLTLMGLSIVTGLFGIYGWRMKHLERKQRQLQEAHDLLDTKVRERTAELAESNLSLINEIEERKRMEVEVQHIHKQLMDASRQAGQAEVASSVLHNVGNVLNSVNVSTTLIGERLRKIRLTNLAKAVQLLHDHEADLGRFLTSDERGRLLPQYLGELAEHLHKEQKELVGEIKDLADNVEHIKEIVAMQQAYARVSGVVEKVAVPELVESAFKMHMGAFDRHRVKVVREFEDVPLVIVDRHKILQILVNILQNAKYACDEGGRVEKKVVLRIKAAGEDHVQIEVTDNGIGIAPQNLNRIFSHGFTTRKNGHGFGLHSAILAAKEMGGKLTVHSDGVGKGATFSLELPLQPPANRTWERYAETVIVALGEKQAAEVSS